MGVLVVEDEPFLLMTAIDLVEYAGFRAFAASNADNAVAILERTPGIAIVFTDVDMPGSMDGLRLAAAVRRRWPPIRVVVTSGHVHVDRSDLPDGVTFFAKPFDPAKVVATLRALSK